MRLQRQPPAEDLGGGEAGGVAGRRGGQVPAQGPLLRPDDADLGLLALAAGTEDPHPVHRHIEPGRGRGGGRRESVTPGSGRRALHLLLPPGADGLGDGTGGAGRGLDPGHLRQGVGRLGERHQRPEAADHPAHAGAVAVAPQPEGGVERAPPPAAARAGVVGAAHRHPADQRLHPLRPVPLERRHAAARAGQARPGLAGPPRRQPRLQQPRPERQHPVAHRSLGRREVQLRRLDQPGQQPGHLAPRLRQHGGARAIVHDDTLPGGV